jgi:hypothetical protein
MSQPEETSVSSSQLEEVPQDLFLGEMLDNLFTQHLSYSQDNTTLNLAEILLLIKQSMDKHNELLAEMVKLKKQSLQGHPTLAKK